MNLLGSHRPRFTAVLSSVALTAAVLTSPLDAGSDRGLQAVGPLRAAPVTDFTPGNIISDAVMYDASSMSQAQVASFIATQGRNCVATSGNTCLKDYRETTPTRTATTLCPRTYVGATNETAAAIITKSAMACGINPQVLLVKLQKEQGLITSSTGKSAFTYSRALGFGCPDNVGGWCDPKYAGFANQVYSAAERLKRYAAYPTSYSHRAYAVNQVRYHPNTACGSSAVYIENQATASLYNYTPYQPNRAALEAGTGTGDACSSYGNRNFHNYFKLWFGSPTGNRAPRGAFESVTAASAGSLRVTGWAFDPDTTSPISVHVHMDSTLRTSLAAGNSRPDIARTYLRQYVGFSGTVAAAPGDHYVCVFAINSPRGTNPLLGCKDFALTSGRQYFLNDSWSGSANHVFQFGLETDRVYVGDWDGDADDTLVVRRGSTYYFSNRLAAGQADTVVNYGNPADVTLVGDWNGDGRDTLAVRRGQTYFFTNRLSGGSAELVVNYGRPQDAILVGDWNGDGVDTLAVRRGDTYFFTNRLTGGAAELVVNYGAPEDTVLVGDWNGDGRDTLAVRRGSTYYLRDSLSSGEANRVLTYGRTSDTTLTGDWDGNGVDTLGVRRRA